MTPLESLQRASSLTDLADILGVKPYVMSYALYKLDAKAKYTQFKLPKKRGGFRIISAPTPSLRNIQRKLAVLLSEILTELETQRAKDQCLLSHGFKAGYSIITNASFHRNKRFVFNLDLRDFFPSINFGRIRGFFTKDRNFALHPNVATVIAQIACHSNELPQGSPCSPVLSNLIAHMMDIKLNKLAKKHRCSYTRYADDLSFSTNEKHFPDSIARLVRGSEDKWVPGYDLVAQIWRSGFSVNEYKTRMQWRDSRQEVTGLIVNKKINVRREYYDKARVLAHHLFTQGFCYSKLKGTYEVLPDRQLDGMLSFIDHVKKDSNGGEPTVNNGFVELYRRYLDYRAFHGLLRPKIICEGKTDSIYVKAALRSLHAKFPELIDHSQKEPIQLDFFGFSDRAEKYQGLTGGGDQLNGLLGQYRKRTAWFKITPRFPLIMVVDNDSGSTNMFTHLSKVLGTHVDGSGPFYYVYLNLYVVPIPKLAGASTAIEDLFEKKVLDVKIDGRSFDRSDKLKDKSKWYGKMEFATKVVRAQRSTIDFQRFEPLLRTIVDVTIDYSKRI